MYPRKAFAKYFASIWETNKISATIRLMLNSLQKYLMEMLNFLVAFHSFSFQFIFITILFTFPANSSHFKLFLKLRCR